MEAVGDMESYLSLVGGQRGSGFGRRFRSQFRDSRGTAELAMLAAPSEQEYQEFCQIVKAMTAKEKANVSVLNDEDVRGIAERAGTDGGLTAIFLNGYVLARQQAGPKKNDTR